MKNIDVSLENKIKKLTWNDIIVNIYDIIIETDLKSNYFSRKKIDFYATVKYINTIGSSIFHKCFAFIYYNTFTLHYMVYWWTRDFLQNEIALQRSPPLILHYILSLATCYFNIQNTRRLNYRPSIVIRQSRIRLTVYYLLYFLFRMTIVARISIWETLRIYWPYCDDFYWYFRKIGTDLMQILWWKSPYSLIVPIVEQ